MAVTALAELAIRVGVQLRTANAARDGARGTDSQHVAKGGGVGAVGASHHSPARLGDTSPAESAMRGSVTMQSAGDVVGVAEWSEDEDRGMMEYVQGHLNLFDNGEGVLVRHVYHLYILCSTCVNV